MTVASVLTVSIVYAIVAVALPKGKFGVPLHAEKIVVHIAGPKEVRTNLDEAEGVFNCRGVAGSNSVASGGRTADECKRIVSRMKFSTSVTPDLAMCWTLITLPDGVVYPLVQVGNCASIVLDLRSGLVQRSASPRAKSVQMHLPSSDDRALGVTCL